MENVYIIFKRFLDPIFIIFILVFISFILCLINSKKKNGAFLLFLSIIIIYGAGIAPVANYLCYRLEKDYIISPAENKNIDVIVVLGNGSQEISSLNKSFLTQTGYVRLLQSVLFFNKMSAKYLVCSGKGYGKLSEAELMARLAEKLGVPKDKIRMEANANNTWESAVELNKMFANKNINIGLVTSAFHMQRSEREFRKYFNNVVPLPSDYLYSSPTDVDVVTRYIPSTAEVGKTSVALREMIGQLWYRLKDI
jgi:uncharacterized SAM-binding protein YcdF (DUF218 family)